jgi:hypothetical protein
MSGVVRSGDAVSRLLHFHHLLQIRRIFWGGKKNLRHYYLCPRGKIVVEVTGFSMGQSLRAFYCKSFA